MIKRRMYLIETEIVWIVDASKYIIHKLKLHNYVKLSRAESFDFDSYFIITMDNSNYDDENKVD